MKVELTSVVLASPDQMASSVGGETVILGLKAGHYFGVSAVAARVWELLQTPTRVSDIVDRIVAEYEVPPALCATDVVRLLQQMSDASLLEVRSATAP